MGCQLSCVCVCMCVRGMHFGECAGKKIACASEILIKCLEGVGGGVQRSIWHVHNHCFGISALRRRTGSVGNMLGNLLTA